jgi:hypothetical protein
MDGDRFDAWTRSFHPRRTVVRALAAMGVGLGLPRGVAALPGQCLVPGEACDPANRLACCSQVCAKHKHKHRCAPAGAPYGCAKQDGFCRSGENRQCPDVPESRRLAFCANDNKGEPICVITADCHPCKRDADCANAFGSPLARCIKTCASCNGTPAKSVCVTPLTAEDLP